MFLNILRWILINGMKFALYSMVTKHYVFEFIFPFDQIERG